MTDVPSSLADQVAVLPTGPGVYRFRDAAGRVLYVGKARNLRARVRNYLREGADGRHHVRFLMKRVASVDCIVTGTEQEALILENNLIKKHRPRYNIFLRDDKTYVNLRLDTRHPFPRLTVVRRPRRDGATYFGPFASAGSVRSTLRMLGRVFPLRTCSDADFASRTRPCLYYHIHRCPAPCVGLADADEYAETVRRVTMFLRGRSNELVRSLSERMDRLAAERRYEEAARVRDQIRAIRSVVEKQRITSPQAAERDVFAASLRDQRLAVHVMHVRDGRVVDARTHRFDHVVHDVARQLGSFVSQFYLSGAPVPPEVVVSHRPADADGLEALLSERRGRAVRILEPRRGERAGLVRLALENARTALESGGRIERNRELLEDLRDLLDLTRFPRRIECYDISNLQGNHAVGSGVCFIEGEPSRAHYRHYRIRTVEGADDYAMMREVLERRVVRGLREGDLPDLLVVDGGRGQLGVAIEVLERLGADVVDVVGIAKVRDARGRAIRGRERIHRREGEPLLLEGNVPALYLLERVRDEAHRFALAHHRRRRRRSVGASDLDAVEGVGPVLKRRLLAEFGSVERLRRAPVEAIATVRGVSPRLARAIRDALAASAGGPEEDAPPR